MWSMRIPDMDLLGRIRPPPSPDLSPLDYHVWGYIKNTDYESKEDTKGDYFSEFVTQDKLITLKLLAILRVPY
jgi:hypothetical protein